MIDHLRHLSTESARFREALEEVDAEAQVPSCPGWTAADLLWHLTEVQHFWGSIVAGRLQDPAGVGDLLRPEGYRSLLHRADAELVSGSITAIDAELAADGIDEILRVMVGSIPGWGCFEPDGATIRIACTDRPGAWGLALGRFVGISPTSGQSYDEPAASVGLDAVEPDLVLQGAAAKLDLWLWGRSPLEGLDTRGDDDLAARLRDLIVEVTQ
jgi:hypothetical protein